MRKSTSLLLLLGAAVAVLASTGCATVSVDSSRYLGVRPSPPTSPSNVEILRREPRRPHEQIGEVILQPSGNPPVEKMEWALKTEAAKLGADAAVLVADRTRRLGTIVDGPWWARRHYPVYGRVIVAVAIRYR